MSLSVPAGGSPAIERPSIGKNSVARMLSMFARVVLSTASAIVTARVLGPYLKGTLSSLLFVTALLSYACSLGLGEAATVLAGGGMTTLRRAFSASLPALAAAYFVGVAGLAFASQIADWQGIRAAVVVAGILLATSVLVNVFTSFVEAQERLTFTALASAVGTAIALVATTLFVAVLDLGVEGGMAGALAGSVVILVMTAVMLRRSGYDFRPVLDRAYLRRAVRLGSVLETTLILWSVAERADLLIVYALAGAPAAGVYAVSLSVGQLSVYASSSIASAVFPRVATLDDTETRPLLALAARICIISAGVSAVVIGLATPVLVPVVFGPDYESAVVPGVVIAFSALAYGPQLTLGRALAARNYSLLFLGSFGISVGSMLALDLLLVPRHGATGAAIASAVASTLGMAFIVAGAQRANLLTVGDLRPRRSDVSHLTRSLRAMAQGPRNQ